MKLGFVSAILDGWTFEEMIDTAANMGFSCVEVACWPVGKAERRYAGVSHINVDELTDEKAAHILDYCQKRGVTISSLAFYPNTMDGNLEKRAAAVEHLKKVICASAKLGVNMVTTFIGRDQTKSVEENLELVREVWPPIIALAEEKGVKIAGWQELAECSDEATAAVIQKVLFVTHVWNTMGQAGAELPYKLADKGYPVVLSNVDYTYADQAYSSNKEEIAHSWAHYIDDTRALTMPIRENKNICGIQGQLFTETIRSFDDVCYDIFPKMLGVFERAWNAENGRDCSQFYSTIVYNEMPYWELLGIRYHIPQPGLKVENGHVSTYSLLPAAEVIVTKDGERVYARTRYGSQESVRTTASL